jgi:hypothetical protein
MEGLPRDENPPAALVVLSDVATLVEISVLLIVKCRRSAVGHASNRHDFGSKPWSCRIHITVSRSGQLGPSLVGNAGSYSKRA